MVGTKIVAALDLLRGQWRGCGGGRWHVSCLGTLLSRLPCRSEAALEQDVLVGRFEAALVDDEATWQEKLILLSGSNASEYAYVGPTKAAFGSAL